MSCYRNVEPSIIQFTMGGDLMHSIWEFALEGCSTLFYLRVEQDGDS